MKRHRWNNCRSRITVSLMTTALLLLLLPGCAEQNSGAEPISKSPRVIRLEYWTPFSGGDNQFMTEMVERFNEEHPEIQVVQKNSRLDDYYSRLKTAVLSGNAPDVAIVHSTIMPQFVQNGYVEELTTEARDIGIDWKRFNPNILRSVLYEDEYYGVPLDTHALVMYYNKDWLSKAGVLDEAGRPVIEKGPDGFKSFLEQIRRTVPPDIAPLAQPSTRIDSVWLWWSLYNQIMDGGQFYSEDGTQAVFNNSASLTALTFVNDLYKDKLIPSDINDAFQLFYDGKAAVLITGMWGTGAFEKATGLHFGVVPMPTLYDHPAVWGDSHNLSIPTKQGMTEEKREAVLTFADWIVGHGDMWAEAGHVPSMTELTRSEVFNRLEYRSDYAATANYVAYWPRNAKQWSINERIINEFERMIYGYQTPEEALGAAVHKINADLLK